MRREDFYFDLPDDLIAKQPLANRTASRLLYLNGATGVMQHRHFSDLLEFVEAGDLLVFNDTRVIPARLFGQKETGGKIEILIERVLESNTALAHLRASKSPREGSILQLEQGYRVEVTGREGELFGLRFEQPVVDVLDAIGHVPLPPYIDRQDNDEDKERYQTVYSCKTGAVAAPTAGLHFDQALLDALANKGVEQAFVTLHVGAGTFQPVRVDDIAEHAMHSEIMEISQAVCEKAKHAKARGKRVIAVGTTSVRCLETAARSGKLKTYRGETDIFIYPGFRFQVVDALITNFHLPESTLLMLVSAFAGYRNTMGAYSAAVQEKYRFFSYGDAMFIERNPDAPSEPLSGAL